MDRSPSLHKISPLQQYILEQAKLSGYRSDCFQLSSVTSKFSRFGDKVLAEKRDSFIDSENESHRTGKQNCSLLDFLQKVQQTTCTFAGGYGSNNI